MSERPEGMKHLDEMTCLLYIERQLDRARALEVSAHTQECEACRTLMRALERESRLLTRAMLEEDEPLPSRLAQFQERARKSMHWIWGLVFGMAATGIYALYTTYLQPWLTQLEQAGFGGSNLLGLMIYQGAMWKGWQSMMTLLEVLAMLTLAGLVGLFFRRRIRRGSALALVLAGFCTFLALPAPASATEHRSGASPTVGPEENIKGDIYMSGERVRVEGTVDGDVFAVGKDIDIDGHVRGDVITAGRYLRIRGTVDGNIRSTGNTAIVSGTLGKNILWFGDAVTIDTTGKVGGSVTMFGGTLAIDGQLGRDIVFMGEELTVNGGVGGGIREKGHTLIIGSGAQIEGPIEYKGDRPADVSSGAKLASAVKFEQIKHGPDYGSFHYYLWHIIWAAAYILYGLVLFALMPKFSRDAVNSAEKYGASAALGVLGGFGLPIAAIIVCFTVVGLFIGITTFFLWYATMYYGQLIIGAVVGSWLMGRTDEQWPLIGRMAVGFVILRLCSMIPHVGPVLKYVAAFWGMGAIYLAVYRLMQPVIAPGVPLPPTPQAPYQPIGGPQPA
jgi:cytoskeletal protein CcmA (bactofilin family)